MEEERKGKPVAVIGGMYAKAKQRVLNKMGRRTTLTRNPRVDFISKRVEDIKSKKARVHSLAVSAKIQLKETQKTITDLDRAMLDAFRDELGERKWDDDKGTYVRELHPEEKRLVADMERVLSRCRETMGRVVDSYLEHLEDTAKKPLTYNTPDEDMKLAKVMETKEQYKLVRTLYSDAMIDQDAELASGGNPSSAIQTKVDESKRTYEEMSEKLCDDALKYERIYRDELAQRVSSHFMAEQHLLRGVSLAMKDFMPYTKGLTLDWEEMRTTRRSNLAAMKRGGFDDDEDLSELMTTALPRPEPPSSEKKEKSGSSPLGEIASDISHGASSAAQALSSAGKSASKSISGIVASYGAKSAAKSLKP
eukprot:gb/GEZJ01002276.1/.p1 GENE.gb/GEZJ01002276.1/~~gb/GEZJ01002276.1/.p1  ORF type:complete len:365 (-),score=71.91 gb/GEZJ01002276.1/:351-1445(-)